MIGRSERFGRGSISCRQPRSRLWWADSRQFVLFRLLSSLGEAEKYMPILLDCFDRSGWFYGAFEDAELVGVIVLDSRRIGRDKDQLQLKFLHVSNSLRNRGLGTQLFELAKATAREMGARRLYISATPSENTVNFYLRLGCAPAEEPDPELFELEPEDIHLECDA